VNLDFLGPGVGCAPELAVDEGNSLDSAAETRFSSTPAHRWPSPRSTAYRSGLAARAEGGVC